MKKVVVLFLLLLSQPLFAASTAQSKVLPQVLLEVEKKFEKINSLEADFTQVILKKVFNKKSESKGKIYLKKPDQIKFETLEPEKNLLVGNGKKYWYYTPPLTKNGSGQVIISSANEVLSPLAQKLLLGNFSDLKKYEVKELSKTEVSVTPKKGDAGEVQSFVLGVKDKKIQKIKLFYENGNESEISLDQIKENVPLKDTFFTFDPPKNTKIIQP